MRAISEYSRLVEAPTTDTQAASASEGTCGQGGGRHGGGRLRSNKGHGGIRVGRQGRSFQALEVQAAPQRKSAPEQSAQQWLMHHRSLQANCLTCDIATSAAPKIRVSFHCELKQFSVPFMWQMCFAMLDSEMPAATWGDGGWVEGRAKCGGRRVLHVRWRQVIAGRRVSKQRLSTRSPPVMM